MELDGFKDLEQQRQAREDFFEKSFDPTYIEKGKRGGTGEIRQWKDGKYQKQSDGTWKPVKEGGGKTAKDKPVGSIHEHNGKKYKKQVNGKWLEISEQGRTRKEHLESLKRSQDIEREYEKQGSKAPLSHKQEISIQLSNAERLSDKEYTDEEVGLGSKKEEPKKSEGGR